MPKIRFWGYFLAQKPKFSNFNGKWAPQNLFGRGRSKVLEIWVYFPPKSKKFHDPENKQTNKQTDKQTKQIMMTRTNKHAQQTYKQMDKQTKRQSNWWWINNQYAQTNEWSNKQKQAKKDTQPGVFYFLFLFFVHLFVCLFVLIWFSVKYCFNETPLQCTIASIVSNHRLLLLKFLPAKISAFKVDCYLDY